MKQITKIINKLVIWSLILLGSVIATILVLVMLPIFICVALFFVYMLFKSKSEDLEELNKETKKIVKRRKLKSVRTAKIYSINPTNTKH